MVGGKTDAAEDGWETSPMFLALSSRMAKTESTLGSLSVKVDELSRTVASLSTNSGAGGISTLGSIGSIASEGDARVTPGRQGSVSAGAIGDLMPPRPAAGAPTLLNGQVTAEPTENSYADASAVSANSDNIAALMQQVAALSMSVAQLQKIQQTQVQLTRSNSGSAPSVSAFTAASGANPVAATGAAAGPAAGQSGGMALVDRADAATPTPGTVGGVGAIGSGATRPVGGATAGAGAIGTSGPGPIGARLGGGGMSRPTAPTQLPNPATANIGLPSSPSGPLPSALLSPPLSSIGPAGRRIEQAHGHNLGGNRPGMGRSISSGVLNSHMPGNGGEGGDNVGQAHVPGSRWLGHGHGPMSPAPTPGGGPGPIGAGTGGNKPIPPGLGGRTGGPPGHLQMPSLSMGMGGMGPDRVWSPGGMMTPRVEITQSAAPSAASGVPGTPSLGGTGAGAAGGGAATPGAGIVVTKWDHLNLKPELLRGIAKYGIGPPNKIQARVLPFMLRGSDIIAQAPPTQERIISYVIPSLQLCLTHMPTGQYRGPTVIIVTTTVDQATQCHKLVRNIGGPLGIRSAIVAGVAGSSTIQNEIAAVQRDAVHLLIGTPAKLNEVVSARGPMGGSDCRLLVLDEVDQLIARNLYDNVLSIAKFLPAPRRGAALTPGAGAAFSPAIERVTSPYDAGQSSPFNPNSKTPFPGQPGSRFGAAAAGAAGGANGSAALGASGIERQTCIFSNTIPTDVINFSQSLNVRDPVRVLVRRDGGPNSQESVSSVTPGINLKHTYVYLTITGSAAARADAGAGAAGDGGPGAIGSGRAGGVGPGSAQSEEATRAKEYKLDMLCKMLEDYPMWQAIVHVGTFSMLEAVVAPGFFGGVNQLKYHEGQSDVAQYKLQSRQWETTYLAPDMPPAQRKSILNAWRLSSPMAGGPRFMVIFDVNVKPPEVPWAPLIVNFDLPRSVEGYAARAAAGVPPGGRGGVVAYQQQAIPGAVTSMGQSLQGQGGQQTPGGQGQGQAQAQTSGVFGVIVSFVQAAGGDVEMLRSTECAYRFKSAEIPSVFHDLF